MTSSSIPTLNQRGRTTSVLNEINRLFIDAAAGSPLPALDIGCAFGVASLAAARQGASVVAVDISPEHLAVLQAEARAEGLDVRSAYARFPDGLEFEPGQFGCIHASNLLNFLRGEEIERGFEKIAFWLAQGGAFFSISGTPYAANVKGFIPEYEARRAAGERWPGECEDLRLYSSDPTIAELPLALHLLDAHVLAREAIRAGLWVAEARLFHREGTPEYITLDGRENVALIAVKPK